MKAKPIKPLSHEPTTAFYPVNVQYRIEKEMNKMNLGFVLEEESQSPEHVRSENEESSQSQEEPEVN